MFCPSCEHEFPEGSAPICPNDGEELRPGRLPSASPSVPVATGTDETNQPPIRAAEMTPRPAPSAETWGSPTTVRVAGERFSVAPGAKLMLGRDPRSPAGAALARHENVSRIHCMIETGAAGVQVTDLDSANGTYIDDVPLRANTPTHLPRASRLRLAANVVVEVSQ